MEFITHNGQKISREAISMAILVTDGVGEGNLGMVTTFCCPDQAKMEASEVLSALHQCDSPEPSVVVGSEEVHQHSLYHLSVLPSSLSRHKHSLQGHFLCPSPFGTAVSPQVSSLLRHQGGPTLRRG